MEPAECVDEEDESGMTEVEASNAGGGRDEAEAAAAEYSQAVSADDDENEGRGIDESAGERRAVEECTGGCRMTGERDGDDNSMVLGWMVCSGDATRNVLGCCTANAVDCTGGAGCTTDVAAIDGVDRCSDTTG